jgi:TPR repeat protein
MALCTGFLMLGSASFAADSNSGQPPGVPDRETEALLLRLERQIVAEQIVSPANDNAMETWQRVLERAVATQNSPAVLNALANFEAHALLRADVEKAAGKGVVAVELTVFAAQAGLITGHSPLSTSIVPDAPPAASPPAAREPAIAAWYAGRGDEMLARKDISAARKFYEYAADEGSARAANALARSFDPSFIAQFGVVGLRPDPAAAAAWYRRAAAMGDPGAEARLLTPGTEPAK